MATAVIPIQSLGADRQHIGAVLYKKVTVTLAELIAGKTLIAGVPGFRVRLLGLLTIVEDTFLTLTDMRVASDNATPVVAVTIVAANLVDADKWDEGAVESVLGAGFGVFGSPGEGIQMIQTGTSATGGTSIDVHMKYELSGAADPIAS